MISLKSIFILKEIEIDCFCKLFSLNLLFLRFAIVNKIDEIFFSNW